MSGRVWVTGLGLVTALGPDVESTWSRLVRGERALRPLTLFEAEGQRAMTVGEVPHLDAPAPTRSAEPPEAASGASRTSAMAVAAAGEAMAMARLAVRGAAVGLVVGGTTGGMLETERLLAALHKDRELTGEAKLAEMLAHPLTAVTDRVEESLGPFARTRTLSSACSSGANALVVGAAWLLSGEVDAVVAGGSDALCRLTLSGFNALAALDPEPCRPFDRNRRGTNLGEGAGFVVLEREEAARARGAAPIAELAGWAVGSEAHHITNPAADGLLVAGLVARALARAGLTAADVDYVNAHGTGTAANDRMEASALARVLGGELSRVPVSSSKGQIGHTLGAAGAIEAAVAALAVARRTVVPTAGLEDPDPALPLVHVRGAGREVPRVRAAISSSFGFGGMDTVLVFTEPASAARDLREERPVVTGAAVFGPAGLLGVDGCAAIPDQPRPASPSPDPEALLDRDRGRRLDASARLGAVAVERALLEARATPREADAGATGLVLGGTFGSIDGSAAFLHRVFERGPRAASPAEFPSLVPSACVGHVSIYCGLRGPAFATADLAASGESAVVQASQLVAAGEAARVVAGAAEPEGHVAARVLPVISEEARARGGVPRRDIAAAVVIEAEGEARARRARILARVERVLEWRGDGARELASLRAPQGDTSEVVWARTTASGVRCLERTGWSACRRVACVLATGESDALGAAAVAVAASRIGLGRAAEALVLGADRAHGFAILLAAP